MHPAVFGQGSGLVIQDSAFYSYDPIVQRVHRYDQSGRLTGTFGSGNVGELLTEEMVTAVRSRLVEETSKEEQPERLFDGSPKPEHLPLYGWASFQPKPLFTVSSTGEVWILRYGGVDSVVPAWEVYAPDGTFLGIVRGPERSWILDIAFGRTLLHLTDGEGVESLQLVTLPTPKP